jgi:hypothetical protein
MLSATQIIERRIIEWSVNNNLDKAWKEAIVA